MQVELAVDGIGIVNLLDLIQELGEFDGSDEMDGLPHSGTGSAM